MTFLSRIALRTTAPAPTCTPFISTESVTSAPEPTNADGESTERRDLAAADHHPRGEQRLQRLRGVAVLPRRDLDRRLRAVGRVDRPVEVVEVEHRQRGHQVHVRRVVGADRPHVAPVAAVAVGGARDVVVLEVVDARLVAAHERRHDVAAHVVLGADLAGVPGDRLDQRVGVEDVVAHRGEDLLRAVRQAHRIRRLLEELPDPRRVVGVHVDDAELVGHPDRLPDRRDRAGRAARDVLVDHLREVHPVDVVGADHDDDVGLLVADQVERLVDRVRAAEVPVLADALLRRHRGDVVAEHRRHPPGLRDVPVQAVRLVLRQHDHLQVAGVHDVGEREVDEPVDAAERHRRFRTVGRQRHQPLPLPTGEDDGQDAFAVGRGHGGHASPLGRPRAVSGSGVVSGPCESTS